MSTTAQLLDTELPAAHSRYADAVTEFIESYADMIAIERLLTHAVPTQPLPTSNNPPDIMSFHHPVAAPNVGGNWGDLIAAAFATRSAAWPTADE